jgi:hypothetical protein
VKGPTKMPGKRQIRFKPIFTRKSVARCVLAVTQLWLAGLLGNVILAAQERLPEPPEVRVPFVLQAVNDPVTGKGAFFFDEREIPPVIRSSPGGQIRVEYVNHMSSASQGDLCRWAMHEHDQPTFSWPSCLSGCTTGRCDLDDGHARAIAALCGGYTRKSAARIVLVPHPCISLARGSR